MSKIDTETASRRDGLPAGSGEPSAGADGVLHATALMNGRREVTIIHAGARYRLRITANDKLILTK